MNMVYQNNTLFVDLSGEIDIINLKRKLFSVVDKYNISKVVVDTRNVFNYKRSSFNALKNDYTKEFNGKLSILR